MRPILDTPILIQLIALRLNTYLDQETTLCLVSGYSAPLRMAIIKRWKELEKNNSPSIPKTFAEALQLAADQAKQLEVAAPKVEYFDKVAERSALLNASSRSKSWHVCDKNESSII